MHKRYQQVNTAFTLFNSTGYIDNLKSALTDRVSFITKKPQIFNIIPETLDTNIIEHVETHVFKPHMKTKLSESVMPTYELIIKRQHTDVNNAWNECTRHLHINYRYDIENNRNHESE